VAGRESGSEPAPAGRGQTGTEAACGGRRDRGRGQVALTGLGSIPEVVAGRAQLVGSTVDGVQKREEILLILGQQRRRDRASSRQRVQREHIREGLGLAAVQVRRVVADAEQRGRVEPGGPGRGLAVVFPDLERLGDIEGPRIAEDTFQPAALALVLRRVLSIRVHEDVDVREDHGRRP
jgi:hypothetical protein